MKTFLQTLFFLILVTQICFAQSIHTNKQISNEENSITRSQKVSGENISHTYSVNKSDYNPKKNGQDNSQKSKVEPFINIDTLINTFMNTHHVPGLAACIVNNNKIIWEGYYGYANISENDLVDTNTIFMLASISKTVTASALMKLLELGYFQLDDSINAYLPFTVRNPNHPNVPITFRQLLTHSSSIRDNFSYYFYYWGTDPLITLAYYLENYLTPGGLYYSSSNYSLTAPGTQVDYSNIGAALCGYLAEVISGSSFNILCRDSLFTPLDMNNTGWYLSELDNQLIAHPYSWNGSNYVDHGHYGLASYPDGELRTTLRSLAKWLIANINFGKLGDIRILDSTTVKLMRTVEYWPPDWGGAGLGLIWMTWSFPDGRWVWFHDGRDFGVSTTMNLDEVNKTGVIILTNVNPINEAAFTSLQNDLFTIADTITVNVNPDEHGDNLPMIFLLEQNYPNPFNPSTTIKFTIPSVETHRDASLQTTLKVYDVLGREVATLVDEYKPAGSYEVEFKSTVSNHQSASGIYFYQLKVSVPEINQPTGQAGSGQSFIQTKKMLLLK